jgi:hypothetical protein
MLQHQADRVSPPGRLLLLDARALAAALDDLEVAAGTGCLEPEEHAPLRERSITL